MTEKMRAKVQFVIHW